MIDSIQLKISLLRKINVKGHLQSYLSKIIKQNIDKKNLFKYEKFHIIKYQEIHIYT